MNMDVLADALARHTLQKQGIGPAALIPLAAKAGGGLLAAGKATLPWLGMGGAMAAGDIGIRKMLEPGQQDPQGPQGPGGTGAGMDQPAAGPCGPGHGSTSGMLGGPKGGPPDFGNAHSRDRADPDIGQDDSQRHPIAGFKLAEAAALLTFRKRAQGPNPDPYPYGHAFRSAAEDIPGLINTPLNALAYGGLGALSGLALGRSPGHGAMIGAGMGAGAGLGATLGGTAGYALSPLAAVIAQRYGMDPRKAIGMSTRLGLVGGGLTGAYLGGRAGYRAGKAKPSEKPEEKQSFAKAAIYGIADVGDPGFAGLQEGVWHGRDALQSLRGGQVGQAGRQGLQAARHTASGLGEAGVAGARRAGGAIGSGVQRAGGAIGGGIQRAGRAMSGRPGLTAALAAGVPLALGAGYAALGGGSKPTEGPQGKHDDEKQSHVKGAAAIMSNNLLDVLAFNVEMTDRKFAKRAQGPMAPPATPAPQPGQAGFRPPPPQLPSQLPSMAGIQASRSQQPAAPASSAPFYMAAPAAAPPRTSPPAAPASSAPPAPSQPGGFTLGGGSRPSAPAPSAPQTRPAGGSIGGRGKHDKSASSNLLNVLASNMKKAERRAGLVPFAKFAVNGTAGGFNPEAQLVHRIEHPAGSLGAQLFGASRGGSPTSGGPPGAARPGPGPTTPLPAPEPASGLPGTARPGLAAPSAPPGTARPGPTPPPAPPPTAQPEERPAIKPTGGFTIGGGPKKLIDMGV